MTYQEWFTEMNKGRGTELQGMKRLIKESAARCSRATRDALQPFLDALDELFAGPAGEAELEDSSDLFFERQAPEDRPPVSESGYGVLSEALGNEFVAMMNRYEPPQELLKQSGVPNAFFGIFDALGILDRTFPVTDFHRTWERDEAARKDSSTYAAQIMAMKDMKEEASLKDFLEAAVNISNWKRDPAFREAMKDRAIWSRLIKDDELDGFLRDMQSSLNKYEEDHAKTFKELSENAAKQYREDQNYAKLELSMNALRAIAGEKETDRAKWDDVRITVTEFTNKVRELQQEAQNNKTPDEYQNELADSWDSDGDLKAKAVHKIYNAEPVFMDEFNDNDAGKPCYRRQDFEKSMKKIEIGEFSFGGSPLTDDEFGSLSFLAVFDPQLTGSFMAVDGNPVRVEDPDFDLVSANLVPAVISYGYIAKEINGQKVYGPDNRVGNTMELCVAPAREKVSNALQEWGSGNPEALGAILAQGVNYFVNDLAHNLNSNLSALNPDHVVYSNMTKGVIDLLKRDKTLMEAAKNAGLKEDTIVELEGIYTANRIEKAAAEAKKRLAEGAGGLRHMSAFEKQQCVTAMQRYDALLEDIRRTEERTAASTEYTEISEKFENEFTDIVSRNPNYSKDPVLANQVRRGNYKVKYALAKAMKNSEAFIALGKNGLAGMDKMLPVNRLDPKTAASMSSIELAQKMGLAEQREIKTTAKEIYDQLTKDYKAGRIDYTLYEARLKVMREVTGGDKDAKIDLKALDDAIEMRLERNLGPLEKGIREITKTEYAGDLGTRLKHILNIYGSKPEADPRSVGHGYTQEQFDQLKKFNGNHLYIGGEYLNQFEFAALAVAATQADPKIGGVYLIENKGDDRAEKPYVNAMEAPTVDDAAALRSFYITDLDQGTGTGARPNMGAYFAAVIEPAREKVDSALQAFKRGQGSKEELGKIIGLGMKNILSHSMIVNGDSGKWIRSAAIEGNILGKLAEIAERDPNLKDEVMKNIDRDDLNRAKGMAVIYDIARSSEQAREKLTAAAKGEIQLTEIERRACVELMLRGKVLADLGTKHAKTKYTKEVEKKIADFYDAHPLQDDQQKEALYSAQVQGIEYENVGLPDYVKILGEKGPVFARELLDDKMPSRDDFMKLGDKEILEMTAAKYGSENDPFAKAEYTKPVFNEEHRLDKSMREYKAREAASPQKVL